MININYQGKIHFIENEPYEALDDTYTRGWYIVKEKQGNVANYDVLYSKSIMIMNSKKGMEY